MVKEAEKAERKSFEFDPIPEIFEESYKGLNTILETDSIESTHQLRWGNLEGLLNLPRERLLAFVKGDYEAELEKQISDLVEEYGIEHENYMRGVIYEPLAYLKGFQLEY